MESIIARALEYTFKYWLKSFSRDQFKLQGRTAQLSNLDINGDALHASVGLPPALNVTTARVGKLEITLPSVSNVQIEPIVVQIDRLDLVLEENADSDGSGILGSAISAASYTKGSGYGYADKIADGMTLGVRTVNLLIETRGGAHCQSGATWASPLASITIRNLLLYTTNENWQVVNLKEAREFSNNKKFIYVFKKLEWESLSVDLLPHPDMFTDERFSSSDGKGNKRDDDGAKRLFFGGERFLEGISGEAYITIQRTELNSPLGLEVQLHVTEAVCPALSEPGLRALLRFMTGMYVCLNRGDVDLAVRQRHTEAAGCSLVSILVDHIFLCIKDTEFQLELLMQSLFFSRASVSDGKNTKNLSHVMIAGMFLRDTFSRPPCTLIQPSMEISAKESLQIPDFAQNFCPPIYPLGDYQWRVIVGVPLVSLYALQVNPPPAPPHVASQTVIECQPILIDLQEASCLRIASFLADGIVVSPGAILPDFYVKSFSFVLKGFDLIVPLDAGRTSDFSGHANYPFETFFSGAKLHVEDLLFSESPFLTCKLLNLEKDPACFPLWPGQPIDASQRKWRTQISHLSLSLKTCNDSGEKKGLSRPATSFWTCVELRDACFEAAMVTADGTPLATLPPPEGIVRIGISCQQYLSNTSVDQLFFVLDVYTYFGNVSEKIKKIGKTSKQRSEGESLSKQLVEKIPSDTAVSLIVRDMRLKFIESSSLQVTVPLVQFGGDNLLLKVGHRTLGSAFAVTTNLTWSSVQVDCVDSDGIPVYENGFPDDGQDLLVNGNGYPQMKAVFWTDTRSAHQVQPQPFLDIAVVHVIPFSIRDKECHSLNVFTKIAGVRLGGGMNYTEILLHRFGIFGRDGGPGEGLQKGLKHLSSGPLANLFRSAPLAELNLEENINETECSTGGLELRKPDDVDICIELKDWLFALEGADDIGEEWLYYSSNEIKREELFWHTTFKNLQVKAKSEQTQNRDSSSEFVRATNFPVQLMTVSIEGLQALKPHARNVLLQNGVSPGGNNSSDGGMRTLSDNAGKKCGINLELSLGTSPDLENPDMVKWAVENIKFSVKEPIEAVATKEELEQLVLLCRSEFDSVGRIAAGFLRVFKLEDSLGKGAIDQLSNLGSESLDRIFTPDKLSRRSSIASANYTPSSTICETPRQNVESTISRLENVLADSQAKCSALVVEFSNPEISAQHLADVKQLNQKLESLQVLLMKLRTQI